MNDYMMGRIDAARKLAKTDKEFIEFAKIVTGLKDPKNEPYIIKLLTK